MLHRCRVERAADLDQERMPRVPVVAEHADFDELMREKVDIDFVQHRGGEPVLADGDDGMQGVRFRAQRAALGRCLGSHSVILLDGYDPGADSKITPIATE
jgi:hypothetical protein